MKRLGWIDLLRGFCMMAILWFHTEMYLVGYDMTPYALYVGNALAVFFILSGYLLYKPVSLDFSSKLKSMVRYIVIPYFIFTSIIAIGKYLIYNDKDIASLAIDIITGHASWFIAALILAQLMFLLFMWITKENIASLSAIACCCLILSSVIGNDYSPSPLYYQQDLWHFNEALLACFLLFTGYCYHRYESVFNHISSALSLSLLFIIVILIKYIIVKYDIQLVLGPIIVSNYYVFIIDLLLTGLLLISLFKRLPSIRLIEWTGSHSIVYYFICGAVPMTVSRIFHSIGISDQSYLYVCCAFIVVYLSATLITWTVYKYTSIFKKQENAGT